MVAEAMGFAFSRSRENRLIGFSADNSCQRHVSGPGISYVERTVHIYRRWIRQPRSMGTFRLRS